MSSRNPNDPEYRPEAQHADRSRGSLALRLTLWYAGSAFLLILLATGFLYQVLGANLDREDDQFLADKIQFLSALLRDHSDDARALRQEVEWKAGPGQYAQFSIRILDEKGQTLLETPGMSNDLGPQVFPPPLAEAGRQMQAGEIDLPSGKSYRIVSARAVMEGGNAQTRLLQVALDRSYEEGILTRFRWSMLLVLALALVACAGVGYRIARRGLRPIQEITATAGRIRSTTLDKRIESGRFPAELSVLAATFNEMLDRLEESFQRLSQFSADIAHELRTPLSNLRGEAEVALIQERTPAEYQDVLTSCLEETARLSRMVDSLLFLARAENAATPIAKEPVDLGQELVTVREYYEAAATEAGIQLTVSSPPGLQTDLDRTLFQRAVGNLLENSLAHTPAGGTISLTASRDNGQARVEVVDTGAGIAAEHLPRVLDRFYRADQARSGASGRVGLGLAIVKSIASLHHGSIRISSEVGKGTRVTLLFPSEESSTT
jgi:two-component system heavy metal sensor histidine kinase CusS